MADGPYKITRAELAKFLPSQRAIRAFEQLFDLIPGNLNSLTIKLGEVEIDTGTAIAAADAVAGATDRLSDVVKQLIITVNQLSNALNQLTILVNQLSVVIDYLQLAPVSSGVIEQPRKPYGAFHSNTTQTAGAVNTAYAMTYDVTDLSFNVYVSSASRVYVASAGVYNFQFSAQLEKTTGNAGAVYIWPRINGVDIPDSATKIRIQGNNAETVAAWNFVFQVNAGDYFELMWSTDDTTCQIFASAASSPVPSIPSVILTVTDNFS
jgi:hypothetical protein